MSISNLDALDEQILKLISNDARIPFLEVARACHVSGAAIHQRIQKMVSFGVIKGSQFVLDPQLLGYETCAFVGLFLKEPSDFDRVVAALREMPEVVECHYTTGGYDIFIKKMILESVIDDLHPSDATRGGHKESDSHSE